MVTNKQQMSPRQWGEWFFYFAIFFGGYLFMRGPAANTAQLAFRLTLIAVGVIGAIVMLVLRLSKTQDSD